jgi:adenosylcobinamide-phosphate synthase
MNFIPARLTWLLLSILSLFIPGCSAGKAFRVGWRQHAVLPGPNSGWSEAATAGGIQRKLLGEIWAKGVLVTDIWLGDPADPPAGTESDVPRATTLIITTGIIAAAMAVLAVRLI